MTQPAQTAPKRLNLADCKLTDEEKAAYKARLDTMSVPDLVSEFEHHLVRMEHLTSSDLEDESKFEDIRISTGKFVLVRKELYALKRS